MHQFSKSQCIIRNRKQCYVFFLCVIGSIIYLMIQKRDILNAAYHGIVKKNALYASLKHLLSDIIKYLG